MSNPSIPQEMSLTWAINEEYISLYATTEGLTRFSPATSIFQAHHWTSPLFHPQGTEERFTRKCKRILTNAWQQLQHYGTSFQESFGIPYSPQGTREELAVWNALAYVPYGTFITTQELYAALADMISPTTIQAAIVANPLPIFIPSHRVVDLGSQEPHWFLSLREYEKEQLKKFSDFPNS